MDQVTELVEQRDDVGVLHQPAREVAGEHALGQLAAGDPGNQVELRGVLVLAFARVQVEVDPPQYLAVAGAQHVVAGDVRVPHGRVRGRPVRPRRTVGR